jgi:serine/threonine protein kinase
MGVALLEKRKLADFGVARHAESTMARSQCAKPGTVLYMAPELLRGEAAMRAGDIWAPRITAFEMAVGVPLGMIDSGGRTNGSHVTTRSLALRSSGGPRCSHE